MTAQRRRVDVVPALAVVVAALAVAVALLVGVRLGIRVLAVELAVLGLVRLALPARMALAARSRVFDVTFLLGAAVALGYLSFTPTIG